MTPAFKLRGYDMNRTNGNAGRQPGADTAYNTHTADDTQAHGIKQYAKRLIVWLACWNILPIPFATWLIRALTLGAE